MLQFFTEGFKSRAGIFHRFLYRNIIDFKGAVAVGNGVPGLLVERADEARKPAGLTESALLLPVSEPLR